MAEMPGIPDPLSIPPPLPPLFVPGVAQDTPGAAPVHDYAAGGEEARPTQEPSRAPGQDLVSPKKRAKPGPKSVDASPGTLAPPAKKSHKAMVRPPGEGGWGPGGQLHLPLQRVKNMMKANERVAIVTTEAAILTTKATETFIAWVTKEGFNQKDAKEKKRGLLYEDLADAVDNNPMQLEFCKDLIPHKRAKWEHLGIEPPKEAQKKPSRPSLPRKATQPKAPRSSSPAGAGSPHSGSKRPPGTRAVHGSGEAARRGSMGASPGSQGGAAKDDDDDDEVEDEEEDDEEEIEEDVSDLVSGLVEASGHRHDGGHVGALGATPGHGAAVVPRAMEKAANQAAPAQFPFLDQNMLAQLQQLQGGQVSFDPTVMAQLQQRMQEQMRTFAAQQMAGGMHNDIAVAAAGAAVVLLAGSANPHVQQQSNGISYHSAAPTPGDEMGHGADGANGA